MYFMHEIISSVLSSTSSTISEMEKLGRRFWSAFFLMASRGRLLRLHIDAYGKKQPPSSLTL